MATFPSYNPVYGASKKSEPRVRRTSFGDGYEQRISFGLNANPKQWSLEFNLSEKDADTVEAFFDARALDGESFNWTPPGASTSYRWVCDTWDRNIYEVDRSRITAVFRQVFEP